MTKFLVSLARSYLVQLEEYAGRRLVEVVFVAGRARMIGSSVHVARLAFRWWLLEAAILTVLGVGVVMVGCKGMH